MYQIRGTALDTPGFYRLEAWPDPVTTLVRISYDPTCADEDMPSNVQLLNHTTARQRTVGGCRPL